MSITHSVAETYKRSGLSVSSETHPYTADGEVNYNGSVATGVSNQEIDVAFTVANVKSLCLFSDFAVTLKTNNSGSPDDTFALAAKKAVIWTTDHLEDNPFTTNVTKMYVSNSSGSTATVQIAVLTDITP